MTGRGGRQRRAVAWLVGVMLMGCLATPSLAQSAPPAGPATPTPTVSANGALDLTNPVSILQNAGQILPPASRTQTNLPGMELTGPVSLPAATSAGATSPAAAQGQGGLSTSLSILVLLTVLSVAPAILVLCTSFTRIVIVLSLLRQAIGTQSLPPSQVIVGLSLFLSFLVMAPTFDRINREAIVPLQAGQIDQMTAWTRAKQPLRDFMFDQIEHARNWDDLYMILQYRGIDTSQPEKLARADVDMLSLVPAFVLSELKVAFLMGFRLYLPFLIIDMVVSSVLISMGMMMLPPVLVSLPFKLLLFVLVDGWRLVVGNLLHSFATPGPSAAALPTAMGLMGMPGLPGVTS